MKLRKLKRGNKKKKSSSPSPRIKSMLDEAIQYIQYDNLEQAETICREIIRVSPRTSEAYNILGIIYQERGQFAEAISELKQAVKIDPTNAMVYFNLGTVLSSQAQYEQAVQVFRRGLDYEPKSTKAINNLGLALVRLGKLDEALQSLEKATQLDPDYGDAWFNLGDTFYSKGELQKAVKAFQRCISIIPDFIEAHFNMSIAFHDLKQIPEAIKSLQRTIELDPEHKAARHMLASLTGVTPDSAPEEFVTNLFDQYSAGFEDDLTKRLEYKIPSLLRQLFDSHLKADHRFSRVIDLGCGTGLSGQAFHDLADYLAGIDISGKMLEIAEQKKIYTDLFLGDLCEQLQQMADLSDLFIATDVMIYVGNLEPLFSCVSSKAEPGAFFAFSVEALEEGNFTLQPTGRYAHSSTYIYRLAADNGFTIVAQQEAGIRKEGDEWIPGEVYILQKN